MGKIVVSRPYEVEGLGDRVKAVRVKQEKAVSVLIEEAGLSRMQWHNIEADKVLNLPAATLDRVGKALGVDFLEAIYGPAPAVELPTSIAPPDQSLEVLRQIIPWDGVIMVFTALGVGPDDKPSTHQRLRNSDFRYIEDVKFCLLELLREKGLVVFGEVLLERLQKYHVTRKGCEFLRVPTRTIDRLSELGRLPGEPGNPICVPTAAEAEELKAIALEDERDLAAVKEEIEDALTEAAEAKQRQAEYEAEELVEALEWVREQVKAPLSDEEASHYRQGCSDRGLKLLRKSLNHGVGFGKDATDRGVMLVEMGSIEYYALENMEEMGLVRGQEDEYNGLERFEATRRGCQIAGLKQHEIDRLFTAA